MNYNACTVSSPTEIPDPADSGVPLGASTPPDESSPEVHLSQIDPPHPFRSGWKIWLIAAVVVIGGWAIYWHFVQQPPVAAGTIVSVHYYPIQTEVEEGTTGAGMPGSSQTYNELLILADIQVRDQAKVPLFLNGVAATLTLPGDQPRHNLAAGKSDFARVFEAYPSLNQYYAKPFQQAITLHPGEQTEGLAIFSFPITQQQWDSRQKASVVVSLIHQSNLLLPFPK